MEWDDIRLAVNDDLLSIATEIVALDMREADWAERESDDQFQTPSIVGGFDRDENAFCFSTYDVTARNIGFS